MAWGNSHDIKIKTGHDNVHRIQRFVGGSPDRPGNIHASTMTWLRENIEQPADSITLDRDIGLDPAAFTDFHFHQPR